MLLSFQAYLRPCEALGLRKGRLLRPLAPISTSWSLIISPQELGRTTKTGSMDDSLLLDHPRLRWMDPIWNELSKGDPAAPLFQTDYRQVLTAVTAAGCDIGIALVPYQLRHSGASSDMLARIRGHWRS